MSSGRSTDGRFATKRSPKFIAVCWAGAALSLGLLYFMARVLMADAVSFRSCNANNAGIQVVSCGKGSVNLGDVVIIGLFILAAILTVSLFTAAWRASRGLRA